VDKIIIRAIGQSTFLINFNNKIILTDPWFGNFLRKIKILTKPDDIDKCDIFLVSHPHIDHLDKKALILAKRLNSIFIGPESACKKAKKFGIKNIISLKPDKEIEINDIKIHPIKAHHTFSKDALCFVIGNNKKIFFSGDTKLNDKLINDLKKFEIDIAIVQICCAYYPLKDGMDINDAVKLIKEINPKVAIPMHYHMYFKNINPIKFKNALTNSNIEVYILNENTKYKIT
jgi:L-ascorbate metabolism protein UlaG (beta-lactamase superfamily)